MVNERDLEEVLKLYNSFRTSIGFAIDFETAIKINGIIPNINGITSYLNELKSRMAYWGPGVVQKILNTEPEHDVSYVILEKTPSKIAVLYCYGLTVRHGPTGRYEMGGFIVAEEYEKLRNVFNTFADNPNNAREFVKTVFDWKNQSLEDWIHDTNHRWEGTAQRDLFATMKKMVLLDISNGKGPQTYDVKK